MHEHLDLEDFFGVRIKIVQQKLNKMSTEWIVCQWDLHCEQSCFHLSKTKV